MCTQIRDTVLTACTFGLPNDGNKDVVGDVLGFSSVNSTNKARVRIILGDHIHGSYHF